MATYSQTMELLSRLYWGNPDVVKGALRGRVQNLQKLGIPRGDKPGKGGRVDYGRNEIYTLIFAMELFEMGLGPAQIQVIVNVYWERKIGPAFREEWESPTTAECNLDAWPYEVEHLRLFMVFNCMSSVWKPKIGMRAENFKIAAPTFPIQGEISGPGKVVNVGNPLQEVWAIRVRGKDVIGPILAMEEGSGSRHVSTMNLSKIVAQVERELAEIEK
ncbi:hypothetical protein [Methylocystis sp. ATCC 49242]|uniref:hypothetical protein n=1 Tax=Methylocystis sp. ATCC 49242 TaxID=622637 RepID=UPI0001F86CC6|nr:hypothetical protein [Methylocystis sp. ATCC 49242]